MTIVDTQGPVGAVKDAAFIAPAHHIVQQDRQLALTVEGIAAHLGCTSGNEKEGDMLIIKDFHEVK